MLSSKMRQLLIGLACLMLILRGTTAADVYASPSPPVASPTQQTSSVSPGGAVQNPSPSPLSADKQSPGSSNGVSSGSSGSPIPVSSFNHDQSSPSDQAAPFSPPVTPAAENTVRSFPSTTRQQALASFQNGNAQASQMNSNVPTFRLVSGTTLPNGIVDGSNGATSGMALPGFSPFMASASLVSGGSMNTDSAGNTVNTVNTVNTINSGQPITSFAPLPALTSFKPGVDVAEHCQVTFDTNFNQTVGYGTTGSKLDSYCKSLIANLALVASNIGTSRITDVSCEANANGNLAVRFTIQPEQSNCAQKCVRADYAAVTLRAVAEQGLLRFNDSNGNTLSYTVGRSIVYLWTDNGPCPTVTCPDNSICDVTVSGKFYCKAVPRSSSGINKRLLGLLVIPIVLILVLVAIIIYLFLYRPHLNEVKKRNVRDDMLSYDAYLEKQHPEIAAATVASRLSTHTSVSAPGTIGRLFRSLAQQKTMTLKGSTCASVIGSETSADSGESADSNSTSSSSLPH